MEKYSMVDMSSQQIRLLRDQLSKIKKELDSKSSKVAQVDLGEGKNASDRTGREPAKLPVTSQMQKAISPKRNIYDEDFGIFPLIDSSEKKDALNAERAKEEWTRKVYIKDDLQAQDPQKFSGSSYKNYEETANHYHASQPVNQDNSYQASRFKNFKENKSWESDDEHSAASKHGIAPTHSDAQENARLEIVSDSKENACKEEALTASKLQNVTLYRAPKPSGESREHSQVSNDKRRSGRQRSSSRDRSRRRSRSRSYERRKRRSRSRERRRSRSRNRNRRSSRSRSRTPSRKKGRSRSKSPTRRNVRSWSKSPIRKKMRSRSKSPIRRKMKSRSKSPVRRKVRSRSKSPVRRKERSKSPVCRTGGSLRSTESETNVFRSQSQDKWQPAPSVAPQSPVANVKESSSSSFVQDVAEETGSRHSGFVSTFRPIVPKSNPHLPATSQLPTCEDMSHHAMSVPVPALEVYGPEVAAPAASYGGVVRHPFHPVESFRSLSRSPLQQQQPHFPNLETTSGTASSIPEATSFTAADNPPSAYVWEGIDDDLRDLKDDQLQYLLLERQDYASKVRELEKKLSSISDAKPDSDENDESDVPKGMPDEKPPLQGSRSRSGTPPGTKDGSLEMPKSQVELEKKLNTIDGMIGVLAHLLSEKESPKKKSKTKEEENPPKEEVKKKKKRKKGKRSSKKESDDSDSSEDEEQVKSVRKRQKSKKKSKKESDDSDSSREESKVASGKKKQKSKKATKEESADSDSSREENKETIVKKKQKPKKVTKEASADSDSSQEQKEVGGKKKQKAKRVIKEEPADTRVATEVPLQPLKKEKKPVAKKDIEKDMYLIGTTLPGLSSFFDPGFHWCRVCNIFHKTAKEYLNHLHSSDHKELIQEKRLVEYPWHSFQRDEDLPLREVDPGVKNPIQGLPFFTPVSSWYCRLCDYWIGDLHCASIHLKSEKHNREYSTFLQQNPTWLQKWTADREEGCEKITREKRISALAKQRELEKEGSSVKGSVNDEETKKKEKEPPPSFQKSCIASDKQTKEEKPAVQDMENEFKLEDPKVAVEKRYRKPKKVEDAKESAEQKANTGGSENTTKESSKTKSAKTEKAEKISKLDKQNTESSQSKRNRWSDSPKTVVENCETSKQSTPVKIEEKDDDDIKREKIVFDLSKKNILFSKVEKSEPVKEVFETSNDAKGEEKPEKERRTDDRKKKDASSDEGERDGKRGKYDRRYDDKGKDGSRKYSDKHRDRRRISPESRRFREIYKAGYGRRDGDERRRGREERSPVRRQDKDRDRRQRDRSPDKFQPKRDRSRDKSPPKKYIRPLTTTVPKPKYPIVPEKKKDTESNKKNNQTSQKDISKTSNDKDDTKDDASMGSKLPFIKRMPTWKKKSNQIAEEIERVHAMSKKASEEAVSLDTYLSLLAADETQPERTNSETGQTEIMVPAAVAVETSAPPVLTSSTDETAVKAAKKKKPNSEALPQDFQDALNILFPSDGTKGSANSGAAKTTTPASASSSDAPQSNIDRSTYEQAMLMSGAASQYGTDPASMQYWQYMAYGAQAQAMAAYGSMGYDVTSGYDASSMYGQSSHQPLATKKSSKPVSAISDEDLAMLGIEKDDNVVKSISK